ncbi:MAG: peptidoglycan-binding protein [Candidatus Omnitrophica bacterium]|nr:peptidoglycan-binding protein [Candidatus Omnitrophota bacterium]
MDKRWIIIILMCAFLASGCDALYGVLQKPGGEEHKNLGEVVYNEYNPKVEELQKFLKALGYAINRPDGKFGASTREAVVKFQTDEGLKATRFVDNDTWARLQTYADGPFMHKGQLNLKAIQKVLSRAGYDPGRPDGMMGNKTHEAIKAFQKDRNLDADGHVGPQTLRALAEYVPKPAEQ